MSAKNMGETESNDIEAILRKTLSGVYIFKVICHFNRGALTDEELHARLAKSGTIAGRPSAGCSSRMVYNSSPRS